MNNFTFNNDFNNKKPKKEETERERMARIAKVLYPTMKDKRDSIEDETEQWKKSQSYIPKTNQTDNESIKIPKEETERERMARMANALYPTMRKAKPEWSSSACVEQDDSETVDRRDTHRSKNKDEKEEEKKKNNSLKPGDIDLERSELSPLLINTKNKTTGTVTGGAAPLRIQEYKFKNPDEKETEREILKNITTSAINRIKDNVLNNITDLPNKEVETHTDKIDNTIFSDNAWKITRELILGKEGFIPKAKRPLGGDKLTIGYGHTQGVKEGDRITEAEANELYKKDFNEYSQPLKHVKVPLSDNQKAALTSLIYNIGPTAFKNSTLLKKLNQGDIKGAADEFDTWIYYKGEKNQGLINRRADEKKKFLTPDE